MAVPNVHERAILKLNELSDEEVVAVLHYIEAMQSTSLPKDYDEANDPSIGFLSGPTDLSMHTKEILRNEITSRSGWTQKKD